MKITSARTVLAGNLILVEAVDEEKEDAQSGKKSKLMERVIEIFGGNLPVHHNR